MKNNILKLAVLLSLFASCNTDKAKVEEAVIKHIGSRLNESEKQSLQVSYIWTTEKEHIDANRQKYIYLMNTLHDLNVSKQMLSIETNGASNTPAMETGYLTYYGDKIDSLNAITDVSGKVIKANAYVLSSSGDTTYQNTIWLDENYAVKK